MVLEYIALARFKELCDCQQVQNGKPVQIVALEDYAQKTTNEKLNTELTAWNEDLILKWLRMLPSLKNINLMDYYWIARDKLVNTIDAESMVSQIIRIVYKSITTFTSKASLTTEVQKINQLSDEEKLVLFNMIKRNLLENPNEERNFDIIHAIINHGFQDMILIYKEILQNLLDNRKDSAIPAGMAIDMIKIGNQNSDFMALIKSFGKTTRIAKAIEINIKKQ
jgi:hypothetical protein